MSCVAESQQHPTVRTTCTTVSVPIIADCGDRAGVMVVAFPALPRLGDRFVHGGQTWEITRTRDALRGFVASPVRRSSCTC